MNDNDNLRIIGIPKSRFIEATRQAAAETTLDITNVLMETGTTLPPPVRQLFLDAIHTTMTLAVVNLINNSGYDFEEG